MTSTGRMRVYSNAVGGTPIESFSRNKVTASASQALQTKAWLPFASEPYHISPNIEDYVVTPVTIFPAELPNRNGVGFSYEELTKFNPNLGQIATSFELRV